MKILYEPGDRVRVKKTGAVVSVRRFFDVVTRPVYADDDRTYATEEVEPAGSDLPPAFAHADGDLECPHCHAHGLANFAYVEDIQNFRELVGYDEEADGPAGPLYIESHYEVGDDGENPRLLCRACDWDCAIPEGLKYDFR